MRGPRRGRAASGRSRVSAVRAVVLSADEAELVCFSRREADGAPRWAVVLEPVVLEPVVLGPVVLGPVVLGPVVLEPSFSGLCEVAGHSNGEKWMSRGRYIASSPACGVAGSGTLSSASQGVDIGADPDGTADGMRHDVARLEPSQGAWRTESSASSATCSEAQDSTSSRSVPSTRSIRRSRS